MGENPTHEWPTTGLQPKTFQTWVLKVIKYATACFCFLYTHFLYYYVIQPLLRQTSTHTNHYSSCRNALLYCRGPNYAVRYNNLYLCWRMPETPLTMKLQGIYLYLILLSCCFQMENKVRWLKRKGGLWNFFYLERWQSQRFCQRGPNRGLVTLTFSFLVMNFDPLISKRTCIFLSQLCVNVWNIKAVCWTLLKLLWQNQSVDKIQSWPWPLDLQMYRYLSLTILHLCKKYQSCTSKTTKVIVSEPKPWQSSVMTLTFDLLSQKCIGIFLSPSCIYVWNIKAVHWKLPWKLSCQYQSVDKVPLWSWPLTFWPQNV